MSLKALPLLFINLGGEMVYILHQRLHAQNIDGSKSQKVINDIISTMYNRRYMEEIFKPQELHSKKAMRTVFDRLAHASIMRLNAPSMDKLYDLMTMAVKYHVSLCSRPRDLLLVTLNHVDGLRAMVPNQTSVIATLDDLYENIIQTYAKMGEGELQVIRQTLLSFFQDMHVRVSIFLKERQQNQTGRFVLPSGGPVPEGTKIPGKIILYSEKGDVRQCKQFNPGPRYQEAGKQGSLEKIGDRVITLGTNMYATHKSSDATTSRAEGRALVVKKTTTNTVDLSCPDPNAKAQLDLLSTLIGSDKVKQSAFRVNLFNNDEEEESYESPVVGQLEQENIEYVNIDARHSEHRYLAKVMGDMNIGASKRRDDDLLDLMDQA
ncbi:protein OSCP1-like [Watersipora subatra]|uniref:protein OSCP1-like n=1 Tax=Watersipora subatra TaxID=2589382 RepID=UPI00355C8259